MKEELETKFWIVMNLSLPTTITFVHKDAELAAKEAKRLANKFPGNEFVVMESIWGCINTQMKVKKYVHSFDNPNDPDYIPF